MPRGIGTSIGVKLTRHRSPSVRAAEVLDDLGGVPVRRRRRRTPTALPITSLPSRCGLAALPAPQVPEAATTTTSWLDQAGRDRRGEGQGRRRSGSSPGPRSACAPRSVVALAGQLGQPVGPGAGVRRRRRTAPTAAASASRKSAPQSMTSDVVAQLGRERRRTGRAAGPGRRRRGRRASRRSSRSSTRSASGTRCGWSAPSVSPALLPAVRAPISTSGWPRSRRSSSPPAYPLAPATATLVFMVHDYTKICMNMRLPGRGVSPGTR